MEGCRERGLFVYAGPGMAATLADPGHSPAHPGDTSSGGTTASCSPQTPGLPPFSMHRILLYRVGSSGLRIGAFQATGKRMVETVQKAHPSQAQNAGFSAAGRGWVFAL